MGASTTAPSPGDGGAGDGGERDGGEPGAAASDPLELFFDLVFVFAFTRVTAFVAHHRSWAGVARGVALLMVLWWAWVTYSWLMDTTPTESVVYERVAILAAAATMFVVAISVPAAFGDTAALFGGAYFTVRAIHVALSTALIDPESRDRFVRLVPGFLGGPALLVVAGFVGGPLQAALWVAGIAIDYGVLFVRGVAKFDVTVEHFVERYRDIVIIALGESVLAMGFGIVEGGVTLPPRVVAAAFLGIVLVATFAWLYFDYVTLAAEEVFAGTEGYERGVIARNSYAYLHLPIVGGVIAVAFGLEQTVTHAAEPLGTIAAVALYGGGALYLLGHTAFRLYERGDVSVPRLVVAAVSCVSILAAVRVPAVVALGGLVALFVGLAALETAYSPIRGRVRGG